jgi:hypothetical protein
MFRTNLHRIRRAALALAGGAIVATSLMTSVAAAAPAEAPIIKIPRADLAVTPLSLSHDAAYQNVHYRFRITNNGPAASTFKYHMFAKWTAYGQPNGTQDGGTQTVTKNPGESFDVDMYCQISGDGHACGGGVVELTPVNTLDPNTGNNTVEMPNSFQP